MSHSAEQLLGPEVILLDEFRHRYPPLEQLVFNTIQNSYGDSVVLARVGEQVEQFHLKVCQNIGVFPQSEALHVQMNLQILLLEIRRAIREAIESSHWGRPIVIERVHTGRRGRPKIIVDPTWLRWAYVHRGKSQIARFLQCSRTVVCRLLREHGIESSEDSDSTTMVNHPDTGDGAHADIGQQIHMPRNRFAVLTDETLEQTLRNLRARFPAAGIKMLQGMLATLYGHVTQQRIRHALHRIEPVRRVFHGMPATRRQYKVAGPNALWHHDGQHGLIRWSIVIHGFIDGFSRVVTGLRAHDNNRAATVLALFLQACQSYGVPQRVRGDHGVENVKVAEWMENRHGAERGAYIWGRSIHNIRIERLWVDVTKGFGRKWSDFFSALEEFYGLDINNAAHVWLLHFLFLADINEDATLWAASWNRHKMSFRGEASQTPAEMWGFGMLQRGWRGGILTAEEVDGQAQAPAVSHGGDAGATTESRAGDPATAGRTAAGPIHVHRLPQHLNEVSVEPPMCPLAAAEAFLQELRACVAAYGKATDPLLLGSRWIDALAFCRVHHPTVF